MQIGEHAARYLRRAALAIVFAALPSPATVEANAGRTRADTRAPQLLGTLSPRPLPRSSSKLTVGMLACNTRIVTHENPLAALRKVIREHQDLDVLVGGPEWLFLPKTGLYARQDLQRVRSSVEAETRGNPMLVIVGSMAWAEKQFSHNTALIVSDGQTLAYDKQRSGGDARMAYYRNQQGTPGVRPEWVPGDRLGLFRWRDLLVGVELCADHSRGVLRRGGQRTSTCRSSPPAT